LGESHWLAVYLYEQESKNSMLLVYAVIIHSW